MTLAGHLIPGSFFIIFGVWWAFVTVCNSNSTTYKFKTLFYFIITVDSIRQNENEVTV